MRRLITLTALATLTVRCAPTPNPASLAPSSKIAAPIVTASSAPSGEPQDATPVPSSPRAPIEKVVRLADLPIPGPPAFVAIARDVVDAAFAVDPSVAANAGLFEDAVRVPSYSPDAVAAQTARLDRALAALRALPWRTYSVDEQIDYRWVYACAETVRRTMTEERIYRHRPAHWLEPLSNDLIALISYAPERTDLQRAIFAKVPAMVAEMRTVATKPTKRDIETAIKVNEALVAMAKTTASPEGTAAEGALAAYGIELAAMHPNTELEVVGPADYAWRFKHAMLLPWSDRELVIEAEKALAAVDAELTPLTAKLAPPVPATQAQIDAAHALTRDSLLGLYDGIEVALRAATVQGGWVSIPDAVGPIRSRETPDAMVPLSGDGGSMNPPPTYVSSNIGYWNVEHFHKEWTEAERLKKVTIAENYLRNGMGPYSAHEGFPGHHLQLSIARLNKDPLRSILPDGVQNEGWGLYAEQALYDHGGLGNTPESRAAYLRSYRHRIARVIFDAKIERGEWDLQRAADFKDRAAKGKGEIDEDLLRSIHWPTQLVCYFAGKLEIVRLRDEMKKRQGAKFDERTFHDALLAEGSVPVALIRAKMLGEPMPDIPLKP